ncbi:MAG: TrkA family potassium uptake protein [Actinobacteria bacterium HGW-Actinobacteria-7]|jgi:trk system potassium uptake protein TrkA|nr:MAG: TrkA family potassium uptake protein [Actinobacteria bacterium HGW-Actinobacteria-7]
MNVVVVGCGRVGSQLATLLSIEGHNVTVIDKDADAFRRLGTTFNGVTLRGLGFDEDVLEEASIRDCDAFAAVTDLDNTNLMAAEVARKIFGVKHVVARLYNPQRERTYQQLDLDYVCGTTLVAEKLLDKVKAGHGHHVDSFGDVEIVVFKLRESAAGSRVRDMFLEGQVLPAIVARGNETFIPTLETQLRSGDIMRVAVKSEALHRLARFMEE